MKILSLSFALSLATPVFAAVDFEKDVRPILETNCVRCHNPKGTDFEEGKTDLDLTTRATATEEKTMLIPGDPEKSKIFATTILPDDAKKVMPPKNKATGAIERLAKAESDTLKAWIVEGAKWPDGAPLIARKKAVTSNSAAETATVTAIFKKISETSKEASAADMKAYTGTIPGSEVTYDMLPIPGGKFKMGSPEGEPGRKLETLSVAAQKSEKEKRAWPAGMVSDEGPQHEVTISPFWMEKCEVTWNEFELFMYPNEEKKVRESHKLDASLNTLTDAVTRPTQPYVEMSFGMGKDGFPAISMTQHAANKYCQWLSAKTGHFYRLPTEAEWEYAARAGTTTAYFWGDDTKDMGDYCWWGKNADFKYQKVGKKKPNPWGLHDILGNVTEWTIDQYDASYYANSPAVDPWNKATKPYPHSARGGSWDDDDATKLRAAFRRASDKSWKIQDPQLPKSIWYHTDAQFLGFRIVRPLKTPTAAEMQAYWNSGVEKDNPGLSKAE